MTGNARLTIVSGLSGSGKTVALHTLEDAGFYCIDNLPVTLLPAFGRHISEVAGDAGGVYAVGVDARNRKGDLDAFPGLLEEISALGVQPEIVYLTADDATLIKRYSETRRRHPLSIQDTPLADAIAYERDLLAPIRVRADLVLDTTTTTIHQLRSLVRERLAPRSASLSLLFQSFGFKHGVPSDADFVFDVRSLPNPHWEPRLRPLTGLDPDVAAYLEAASEVGAMFEDIKGFLERWIPTFERENRSYLTVAIGCTGGQHRSVYLAKRLATRFAEGRSSVTVRHRELS